MLRNYFKRFRWFIIHYRKQYLLGVICIFLSYGLNLLPPKLIGVITDRITAGSMDMRQLTLWLLGLLFAIILNYIITYIWGYQIYRGSDEISRLSHSKIFTKILRQSPIFFAKNTTGSLMGKATNDVSALEEFAGFGIMALMDATVWPIAILLVMAGTSWPLTLLSCLPLPLLIYASKRIGAILYERYELAQEAFDEMNQSVLEGVAGIRVVRAYHLEEQEKENFARKADELYEKTIATVRCSQLYSPIAKFIPGLAFVMALSGGVYLISIGSLSTGGLLSFAFYLGMLTWPMISIGEFINTGQQGSASMERIDELLRYPEDVLEAPQAVEASPETSIRFDHFSFSYPESANGNDKCLKELCFRLDDGQTLALVGPVGSGKSTILKQLLHQYPLPERKIFLGGLPLESIRFESLRARSAYVPQQSFLFSRSIRENILLGATDEDLASGAAEARLEQVLDLADFRKDLPQLPQGLESLAGEKGIALSGGQKQRICIARALMKNAPLLILDDCLSAVDSLTEERILSGLRRDRKGKTTVIAAHRLSAVLHADLILVLEQGRIVARGRHEQLLEEGGWYATQFRLQQLEKDDENFAGEQSDEIASRQIIHNASAFEEDGDE